MATQTEEKKGLEITDYLAYIKFNYLKFCISTQYLGKYTSITQHILTVSHLPDTLLFGCQAHCEHMPNFNMCVAPMKSQ